VPAGREPSGERDARLCEIRLCPGSLIGKLPSFRDGQATGASSGGAPVASDGLRSSNDDFSGSIRFATPWPGEQAL